MKTALYIIFLLFAFNLKAQYNLVPNYSFETYTSCPNSSGQLIKATNWINPTTSGSPDYFNSCSSILSVPNCNPGGTCFQYAKTGTAYTGIGCYGLSSPNLREYLQTQLKSPLINGKCYQISINVNLINYAKFGCNNIGLNFSVTQPTLSGSSYLLNLVTHVKNFNNKIITDSLNWNLISGIYLATGGEEYITIGNFNNDTSTDTLRVNSSTPSDGAYYLIDDVSVTSIDSIPGGLPANAGPNKNIAIGDSVFIGQQISNLNCNWYILGGSQIATNTSGIYVKPNSPTTYVVEQNLCGTITYDTVNVFVSPTGIKSYEERQNSFNIYPNPGNGIIYVSTLSKKEESIDLVITNLLGETVYTSQNLLLSKGTMSVDLNIQSGTYFVIITDTHTNERTIKKLIIQK